MQGGQAHARCTRSKSVQTKPVGALLAAALLAAGWSSRECVSRLHRVQPRRRSATLPPTLCALKRPNESEPCKKKPETGGLRNGSDRDRLRAQGQQSNRA